MKDSEIEEFLAALPFITGLGIIFVGCDEKQRPVLEMPWTHGLSAAPGLFPASSLGALGDVAAVCACLKASPTPCAAATLDFTIKVTNPPQGEILRAIGRVLRAGKTLSTAQADLWAIPTSGEHKDPIQCGTLLASVRNYKIT